MTMTGISPFPAPSLPRPVMPTMPIDGSGNMPPLPAPANLPFPASVAVPGINGSSANLPYSPVGPAVNGMVPVVRNQSALPPAPLSAFPNGSLGSSPVDSFLSSSPGLQPVSSSASNLAPASATGQGSIDAITSALANQDQPLNARQMGQKVGTVVANFMQENPALLDKLNQVDMDALAEDIGPKVEKTRAQVQQALKKLPQGIDKRLIRMLDPGTAKLATEFDQWLRKEPDPALLAEIARDERLKAREEALGGNVGKSKADRLNDPYADDPFAAEDLLADDPFAEELPPGKTSLKDKMLDAKDKLWDKAQSSWPLNRNQKSELADLEAENLMPRPRKRPRLSPDPLSDAGTTGGSGGPEQGLTDADLDALLGGGGLSFKSRARQGSK